MEISRQTKTHTHTHTLLLNFNYFSLSLFSLCFCFDFFQELNLAFGEITEEAALAVAQAVKDKDQLEKLDLNGANLQLAVILSQTKSLCVTYTVTYLL